MNSEFIKRIKLSVKSVFFNYKRFICFFVMLFIIETLFSAVITLYVNNNRNQLSYLEENYTYHLQLQNLSETQYYYIVNLREPEKQQTFSFVEGHAYRISGTNTYRYDINLRFLGSVSSSYNSFKSRYYKSIGDDGEFKEFATPLLKFEISHTRNTVICVLTCLFIFAAGCFILYILDSIMVNHYKFIYGIYMTFGANFKKLFGNSLTEMILISLIVFIPSQLVSNLACFIINSVNGLKYLPSLAAILLSLICGILVSGVAVFINIKSVSLKTPLSLISSVDNSNLISSPRTSSDFFGFVFPKSIELLSLKRYRKYIFQLVGSAVAFAVIFLSCIYLGGVYSKTLAHTEPQFSLVFNGTRGFSEDEDGRVYESTNYEYSYNNEIRDYLYTFDGIDIITKECKTEAIDINSNVKIAKSDLKLTGKGVDLGDGYKAFLNVDYFLIDDDIISEFDRYGYRIEGNLNDVIYGDNVIAITDGFNNSTKFKLKPGDKIYIATDRKRVRTKAGDDSSDFDMLLANFLNAYDYTYTEYTVGAVIKDIPVGKSFGIYFNSGEYTRVTGRAAIIDKVDIKTKDDITPEQYNDLIIYLRGACDYYTNMEFINNDSEIVAQMEKNKNYQSIFVFVSLMLLIVTPLLWMFSQILFYLKRRPEYDIYFALGSVEEEIKKSFITDALVLVIVSGIAYTLLSFIAVGLLTYVINSALYTASAYMRFSYSFPIVGYLIGLAVNSLSAFLGSYIPYRQYIKACHPVFTGREDEQKNELISEGETGV